MKAIFKISALIASAIALVCTSCTTEQLSTEQYGDDMTLSAFAPNPVFRGGELTILGSGLDKVKQVIVPGVDPITDFTLDASAKLNKITFIVPVDGPEVGKIAISDGNGITLYSKTELSYTEPIVFTSFSPASAMPGDVITIKGDYLNLVQEVIFSSGVIATPDEYFTAQSRYELKVKVPNNAVSGRIIVGDSNEIALPDVVANKIYSEGELTIGKPTVADAGTITAKSGETVTLTGEHLLMINSLGLVGADVASKDFTEYTDSKISFALPATVADGDIRAISYAGDEFVAGKIETKKPAVTEVTPQPVKAGAEVTATGDNLDIVTTVTLPGAGDVAFNYADSKVTFSVPETATEGDITFTAANGDNCKGAYTLVKATITGVTPLEIYAEEELTVTGTDLDLVVSATLGGKEVDLIPSNDGTSVKLATAATSVSGKVALKQANGVVIESEDEVTVNYHSKVIVTSIPAAEHIGQPVSIKGSNLKLVETIYIGDVKVTDYSLRTDEQIVFTMPYNKVGSYSVKFVLYDGDEEIQPSPIEVQLEMVLTTIVEGEFIADNWENQPYVGPDQGGLTYGVKAGDILRIYFEPIRPEEGWQVKIVEGHWGPTYVCLCSGGNDNYGEFTEIEYVGYYDLAVTAEMETAFATQQWWGGMLLLNGTNFKCTKVDLIKLISQEITIWEGEAVADAWGNQPYLLEDASGPTYGIVEGVTLRFYVERIRPEDHWKIQIVEGHWGPTYCSYCSTGADTEDGKFTETDNMYFDLAVTADMADAAAAQGWWGGVFVLNGDNTKVVKLTKL